MLMISSLSYGEFYRYKDHQGIFHYTDNISDVPENQRPTVKEYIEVISTQVPQAHQVESLPVIQARETTDEKESAEDHLEQIEKLKALRTELDREYQQLIKEKERLSKENNKRKNSAEVKIYRQERTQLNQRIKTYEGRREAFEEKLNSHNAKLIQGAELTQSY